LSFSVSSYLTAPTSIYTLSLHDALPIYTTPQVGGLQARRCGHRPAGGAVGAGGHHDLALVAARPRVHGRVLGRARPGRRLGVARSEEHTSELQSRENLVCRLLLEKKNKN